MHEDVSESNRQRVRSCARSGYRRVPHGPSFTGIQSVFYTPRSNVCVQYYEYTRQMRHAVPMLRKRILCVIANHGLIDIITHPSKIFIYTAVLTPIPDIVWFIAFVPASVIHFGQDIGIFGSVLFHLMLTAIVVKVNFDFAEMCLMVFMVCVHIPCAIIRLRSKTSVLFMGALIASGMAGWSLADTTKLITVTNAKLITIHCLLGAR